MGLFADFSKGEAVEMDFDEKSDNFNLEDDLEKIFEKLLLLSEGSSAKFGVRCGAMCLAGTGTDCGTAGRFNALCL